MALSDEVHHKRRKVIQGLYKSVSIIEVNEKLLDHNFERGFIDEDRFEQEFDKLFDSLIFLINFMSSQIEIAQKAQEKETKEIGAMLALGAENIDIDEMKKQKRQIQEFTLLLQKAGEITQNVNVL